MTGRWVTDLLPWRFLVPRRNYFRNARIARVCPEIRGEVNRIAFFNGLDGISFAALMVFVGPNRCYLGCP